MFDVVVCGAGPAGLCAALAAVEQGARVLILEKGDEVGGSFRFSGGGVWAFADMEIYRRYMPEADQAICELVMTQLGDDLQWLEDWGVKPLARLPNDLIGAGISVDPMQMISTLERLVLEAGVELRFGWGLTALDCRDGVTVRAVDRVSGRFEEIRCGAVVVATGGFQGNPEMVTRYLGVSPREVRLRANRWSTGEGLRSVLSIGGAVTPAMDDFYGHALPDGELAEIPGPALRDCTQYYGNAGVALNARGERFVDESEGDGSPANDHNVNRAIAKQPGGVAYYVLDAVTARQGRDTSTSIARAEECGAPVVRADTIEELCDRLDELGVPRARALATLREYNASVGGGAESGANALFPPRVHGRTPLEVAPFRAVRVRCGLTYTKGGIAVDRSMAVRAQAGTPGGTRAPGRPPEIGRGILDPSRAVLPGVFASGVDVGNHTHGGYASSVGFCVVSGRIAGTSAAQYARAVDPSGRASS